MKGLRPGAALLLALAVLAGERVSLWLSDPAAEPDAPSRQTAPPVVAEPPRVEAVPDSSTSPLASVGDRQRDRQIAAVVAAMDERGEPPPGVAQGGRRGGSRGLFENAERRLPRHPRGYYVESDVWPRSTQGGGRGRERLVFGRAGEVYYTSDHYGTFTRLR